jgi:hypothetical protein
VAQFFLFFLTTLSCNIDTLLSKKEISAQMSMQRDNVDSTGDKLNQHAHVAVASAANAFTTHHFPPGQDWLVGKGRRKREDHNQRDHVSSGQGCLHGEGHNEDIDHVKADLSSGSSLKSARMESNKGDNEDEHLASWLCLV